jgi:preprotein translocase subunit SecG
MVYAIAIIQLIVAISLVIAVLLQSGRGGGLAGALGGTGGAGSVFGGRGAGDFLVKVTTGLAIAFVVLTVLINVISTKPSSQRPESVIATEAQKRPATTTSGGGGGMPQTLSPEAEGVPVEQSPAGAGGTGQ